jgi:transposase-like protein
MKTRTRKPLKKERGSILEPQFKDEDAAREHIEATRWPDGTVCPHCGVIGNAYKLTPKNTEPYRDKKGKLRKPRKGLWKCGGCRKQFSVTVKSIFEDSHIPLHKWLYAIHLLCASKKGMSSHQLMRMLDLDYKSAWFLTHRIRYAMTQEPLASKFSGICEADETYIGGRRRKRQSHRVKPGERAQDLLGPTAEKPAVFSIVQRGGRVWSKYVERVTADNLKPVIDSMIAQDAHLITDTSTVLKRAGKGRKHSLVNHSADEYARYEDGVCITTNTIEGYFANLKRGIGGIYHHVGRKHLHRYLSEFDFRYNARHTTDGDRAKEALKGFEGKRLMYKDPIGKA